MYALCRIRKWKFSEIFESIKHSYVESGLLHIACDNRIGRFDLRFTLLCDIPSYLDVFFSDLINRVEPCC